MKYFNSRHINSSIRLSHTVLDKETLYDIAKKYGITIDELKAANNLEDNVIYPNQVLIIPQAVDETKMYFTEYITTNGDTLSKIATKYNIDIDELLKYNDLGKFVLEKNQVMKIPNKYNTYTVTDTDTIDSILYNSKMSLKDLIEANFETLFPAGTVLYIK